MSYIPKYQKTKWIKEETDLLKKLVKVIGRNWKAIAEQMNGRTKIQCMQKFNRMKDVSKKGQWSAKEDQIVKDWALRNGPRKWSICSVVVEGRSGKQCRDRWRNYLDPFINHSEWTDTEQMKVFAEMKHNWSSWTLIAKNITNRSESAVKNLFYSSIRKIKRSEIYQVLECEFGIQESNFSCLY